MSTQTQNVAVIHSKAVGRPFLDRFDLLCVVALILSFLVVSRLPAAPSKYGDIYFHDEAKALAHALRGGGPWSEVSFARAPGPALYYGLPYLFVQPEAPESVFWRAALLWNALWMSVAIVLIRRAGEYLGSELTGKVAALFALLLPFGVYYSFGVAAETPAYVATAVFVFGWARWRRAVDAKMLSGDFLCALIGLLWLILCRPNALVLVGIAALGYAGMLFGRAQYSATDKKFAIFGAAAGLSILLLVSFALKHIPGNRGVSGQASNFGELLFLSNFQLRNEPFDWRFWGKGTRQGSVDYLNYVQAQKEIESQSAETGVPVARLQTEWTKRDAMAHPWVRIKMTALRMLSLNVWLVNSTRPSAFHLGRFRGEAAYFTFHILLNLVALTPVFLSFWFVASNRTQFFAYWPLWGLWAGLLLFHGLTYAEPRYMLPAQPGLIIMAASILTKKRTDALMFT